MNHHSPLTFSKPFSTPMKKAWFFPWSSKEFIQDANQANSLSSEELRSLRVTWRLCIATHLQGAVPGRAETSSKLSVFMRFKWLLNGEKNMNIPILIIYKIKSGYIWLNMFWIGYIWKLIQLMMHIDAHKTLKGC